MQRSALTLLFGAIVATTVAAPVAAYDDFYARRLAAGRQAFAEGKPGEAFVELRIACFGMLDEPEPQTECVARLALAAEAAGQTADTDAALERLVGLEQRFGLWQRIALEPALKARARDLTKKRRGVELSPPATPKPTFTATPTTVGHA